jgi:DNA-binding transcriptional regulator YhcF (GntR family)
MIRTVEVEGRQIRIDVESRVPKYRQIINSIIKDIEQGVLRVGDRMPSINEISEEYYLSRDTVEKAYNELKKNKSLSPRKVRDTMLLVHFRAQPRAFSSSPTNYAPISCKFIMHLFQRWAVVREWTSACTIVIRKFLCRPWKKRQSL